MIRTRGLMFSKINYYFIVAILTCILVLTAPLVVAENNNINSQDYIQQGKEAYDRGAENTAISFWQQAIKEYKQQEKIRNLTIAYNYLAIAYQDIGKWDKSEAAIGEATKLFNLLEDDFIKAQVLNTQGNLLAKTGKLEEAITTWETAEPIYRDKDAIEPLLRVRINQAQAYRSLGYGVRSQNILQQANRELADLPDSILKVKALQSLGISLRSTGDLAKSQALLEDSLNIAQKINFNDFDSINLSLANTLQAQNKSEEAIAIYQTISNSNTNNAIEAKVKLIALLAKSDRNNYDLISATIKDLDRLTNSIQKIKLQINLATNLIEIDYPSSAEISTLLTTAKTQSQQLQNPKLESLATGQIGRYYEQNKQYTRAATATRQAILLANNSRDNNILSQWYWQQGRIQSQQQKIEPAIASYQQAVTTLQSLRQDIAAIDPEIQFSYQDKVEPIYRQYVKLLLQNIDRLSPQTQQQHLIDARNAIESLQIAELENFFQEACTTANLKALEQIDPNAAIVYPIVIEDRLSVILSLPNKPLQHYSTEIPEAEKKAFLRNINLGLNRSTPPQLILPAAQKLYDWLLRSGISAIESQDIKNIVFVLDDWLRNLPISVLHDGDSYLIEKYNLALTPGLQLLESRPLEADKTDILIAGIVQARQGFQPLPSVASEVAQIADLTQTEVLIDDRFTLDNFQSSVAASDYSIVHLATHGQFSSNAEDTFLLAWDNKLKVRDIAQLLQNREGDRNPIELLVLSACETAAGDNRAALGMAGVAVRSGARSTIASLWRVSDRSTAALMSEFYRNLSQNQTKSQSLRQAQLSLLHNRQFNHPYYWSPFTIIGNWL